jgi:hypothetical protein
MPKENGLYRHDMAVAVYLAAHKTPVLAGTLRDSFMTFSFWLTCVLYSRCPEYYSRDKL